MNLKPVLLIKLSAKKVTNHAKQHRIIKGRMIAFLKGYSYLEYLSKGIAPRKIFSFGDVFLLNGQCLKLRAESVPQEKYLFLIIQRYKIYGKVFFLFFSFFLEISI